MYLLLYVNEILYLISIADDSPDSKKRSENPSDESDNTSKIGAIVGGIVGGIVAIVVIAILLVVCIKKRRTNLESGDTKPKSIITDGKMEMENRLNEELVSIIKLNSQWHKVQYIVVLCKWNPLTTTNVTFTFVLTFA